MPKMPLILRRDPDRLYEHYAVLTGKWQCGIIQNERHHLPAHEQALPWRWMIQLGGSTPPGVIREDRAVRGDLPKAKD